MEQLRVRRVAEFTTPSEAQARAAAAGTRLLYEACRLRAAWRREDEGTAWARSGQLLVRPDILRTAFRISGGSGTAAGEAFLEYQRIAVNPVAGALGAEVSGIDLRDPLDEAGFSELNAAWTEHQVLFFRDQDLSPEQHKAFARRFGPLQTHPYLASRREEGHPEVVVFESDASRPYLAAGWHSDMTFLERPPSASVLRGVEVPAFGGDTMFASMYAAYQGLSGTMQRLLCGLEALHDTGRTFSRGAYPSESKPSAQEPPGAVHPVVRIHPVSGRKTLFVNSAFTHRIQGLHRRESQALLAFLYEHLALPEFTCRFRWQKNSLVLWDNRCVQHRAVADNLKAYRRMERVTVEGERPR